MADLADDGVGASIEGLDVFGRPILPPQTLGRKLDGRERVLDLVGDTAGDVAPRRVALRGNQPGDVVEGQNNALGASAGPRPQPTGLPVARDIQFLLRLAASPVTLRARSRGDRRQFGSDLLQAPAEAGTRLQAQEHVRLMIGRRHASLAGRGR